MLCFHKKGNSSKVTTSAVLYGYSLWKSELYKKILERNGINVFDFSDHEAKLVNLVIMDIKKMVF
jgi:hypothetical protein